MFHEIDQDKIDRVRGFDITVVTTAKNDDEGRALLKQLGFPFKSADRQLNSGCRRLARGIRPGPASAGTDAPQVSPRVTGAETW